MDKTRKLAWLLILFGFLLSVTGSIVIMYWWQTYHKDESVDIWFMHQTGVVCVLEGEEYLSNQPLITLGGQSFYTAKEELVLSYANLEIDMVVYPGDVLELQIDEYELDDDPLVMAYEGTILYYPYGAGALVTIELPRQVIPFLDKKEL